LTLVAKYLACDEAFKAAGWMSQKIHDVQVKIHWLLAGSSVYFGWRFVDQKSSSVGEVFDIPSN
jgi:hypothetical protein